MASMGLNMVLARAARHCTAMNSKASHSELCEYALRINEQIQIKALASMLLDGDASEEEYESQGEVLASDENSDGEDGFDASESEEADTERLSDWDSTLDSKVAEALSAIGSYFSPESVREREDRRANTAFNHFLFQSNLSQLRGAQMQLREAETRNWRLSNDLDSVTRRADRMDFQNTILTGKVEKLKAEIQEHREEARELKTEVRELEDEIRLMKRTRHHRHMDSDSESDSPRKRRRRQQQSNPASQDHS
ncbi:hypothetical protein V8E53_000602 [Lactarius tabidus]